MKNRSKIKQLIKVALINAQKSVFLTPILEKLLDDLEPLINEGEKDDDGGRREREGGTACS